MENTSMRHNTNTNHNDSKNGAQHKIQYNNQIYIV